MSCSNARGEGNRRRAGTPSARTPLRCRSNLRAARSLLFVVMQEVSGLMAVWVSLRMGGGTPTGEAHASGGSGCPPRLGVTHARNTLSAACLQVGLELTASLGASLGRL